MNPTLETLIAPLRHSPQLREAVDVLQEIIRTESERRGKFYEEMTPDQKIEFIDGEVVLHSPAKFKHLDVTMNALSLLRTYVQLHQLGKVLCEKCLCVFPRNDYEPEIVFFSNAKVATLQPNTMKFPIPDLIIEVLSDTSEHRDRGAKFEDFQVHGVGEYWILASEKCIAEQYLLRDSTYELTLKSGTGDLQSEVIPGLVIPVKALFFAEENLAALRLMTVSRT